MTTLMNFFDPLQMLTAAYLYINNVYHNIFNNDFLDQTRWIYPLKPLIIYEKKNFFYVNIKLLNVIFSKFWIPFFQVI